jgi:hypothetical protein
MEDLFREDFALLIEAGFVAVKQLDEVAATRLFRAAQTILPEATAPQVGLGYIALNKLEIKEASRLFEGVLQKEPGNDLAKAFLGICLLLNKERREEGEVLVRGIAETTEDPTVKNLCTISLEWAEKDLKKMKNLF